MKSKELINHIEKKDLASFKDSWDSLAEFISSNEKQKFLTDILHFYYSENDFVFFVEVIDKITESNISLDYNIGLHTPTLLSLVFDKASQPLFDYFLQKGASLNFIGDSYAGYSAEEIKKERDEQRYFTCLDYAELKMEDRFYFDYHYSVPETEEHPISYIEIDSDKSITVNKQDYYYLVEQSKYLKDIILTEKLKNYLIGLGAKTYNQLSN